VTSSASRVRVQYLPIFGPSPLGIHQEHLLRSLDPSVWIGGPCILDVGGPKPEYHRAGGIVDLEDGADTAKGKEGEFGRLRQTHRASGERAMGVMPKTPQLIHDLLSAKVGGLGRRRPSNGLSVPIWWEATVSGAVCHTALRLLLFLPAL